MPSNRTSRRDFMNLTGAGMAGLVGAPIGAAAAGQPALPAQSASSGDLTPDLVVVNATSTRWTRGRPAPKRSP
jgi:hypothetical protein